MKKLTDKIIRKFKILKIFIKLIFKRITSQEATKLLLDLFNVNNSLPTVNDIRIKANEYFNSLCINKKSYLYPTKGYIEGALWMREFIKGNKEEI